MALRHLEWNGEKNKQEDRVRQVHFTSGVVIAVWGGGMIRLRLLHGKRPGQLRGRRAERRQEDCGDGGNDGRE